MLWEQLCAAEGRNGAVLDCCTSVCQQVAAAPQRGFVPGRTERFSILGSVRLLVWSPRGCTESIPSLVSSVPLWWWC